MRVFAEMVPDLRAGSADSELLISAHELGHGTGVCVCWVGVTYWSL